MPPDVRVRRATPEDAAAIATIHVTSWQATYRGHLDDAFLQALTPDDRLGMWHHVLMSSEPRIGVLVAEHGGTVAGFASTGPARDTALPETCGALYAIYIDPARTRRGIGTLLLQAAEHQMRANGFETALLWVLRENAPARAFYERHGWYFDGIEKQDELWGQPVVEARYTTDLRLP